ncbi:hypothetical protein EMQ25_05435 [Arsenicitalea aurantiaca]|uniref:Uncharacterized protein n=1 Tax=Arsenicitalea aurantiaca TaxID=1783274 RepID=A0A433XF15_9HYPH|nr:hypothetical protein [Arsenicitalea aurantiaca]RUT32594.1 hypothetical protein EMQ25_05435 [Arsenicitalea aurantiaca]
MVDHTAELIEKLRPYGENIAEWRAYVEKLRLQADEAVASREVDVDALVETEQTAEAIYDAISRFDKLLAQIAEVSPQASGELAEVGEALRLVLLEITELSIQMYAAGEGPRTERVPDAI